tara:strand:- start:4 stop:513 length:510 start_codon:yes stop_codon:yes gene_type:complete
MRTQINTYLIAISTLLIYIVFSIARQDFSIIGISGFVGASCALYPILMYTDSMAKFSLNLRSCALCTAFLYMGISIGRPDTAGAIFIAFIIALVVTSSTVNTTGITWVGLISIGMMFATSVYAAIAGIIMYVMIVFLMLLNSEARSAMTIMLHIVISASIFGILHYGIL